MTKSDGDLIIIDDLPSYRRVALIRNGALDQIWIDDASETIPQLGAVLAARVAQIFPDHQRVSFDLGAGLAASARVKSGPLAELKSGQMQAVMVTALPRDDKPLQVNIKDDVSAKTLPATPQLMVPAPDALSHAQKQCPDADVIDDASGLAWAEHDLDQALAAAIKPVMIEDDGAVLHINTPPGAAVIDLDSGGSKRAPFDLAEKMTAKIMRQIRLRRIGGPIVIDFPRLSQDQQRKIHQKLKSEQHQDGAKLSLHGFTNGGLYTMARSWGGVMLKDVNQDTAAELGRQALRLIRRHRALNIQGGITIRLPAQGLAWLEEVGAKDIDLLKADFAFSPQFISDDSVSEACLDEAGS